MKKLLITGIAAILITSFAVGNNFATTYPEFLIVRVKYAIKKTGVKSSVYLDIGKSKKHSLSGSIEEVADGVIKIGFGKEVAVLSNEVDMVNYFSSKGWEIVKVSELRILNTSYTQYLFKKNTPE